VVSSIEGRHKETTEELNKVKSMSLSSSEEVGRLGKANRELEVECGHLRNKKTSSDTELSSLRQSVKSLRTELSQTRTELTKRTLELTHAGEKMKMVQDALVDSKALVKATSDAASAETKRSNATVDVISTLRTEVRRRATQIKIYLVNTNQTLRFAFHPECNSERADR
jgi:chromosome segregation ATPase